MDLKVTWSLDSFSILQVNPTLILMLTIWWVHGQSWSMKYVLFGPFMLNNWLVLYHQFVEYMQEKQ